MIQYSRETYYTNCPFCMSGRVTHKSSHITGKEEEMELNKEYVCNNCGQQYTVQYNMKYMCTKHDPDTNPNNKKKENKQ